MKFEYDGDTVELEVNNEKVAHGAVLALGCIGGMLPFNRPLAKLAGGCLGAAAGAAGYQIAYENVGPKAPVRRQEISAEELRANSSTLTNP